MIEFYFVIIKVLREKDYRIEEFEEDNKEKKK